MHPKDFDKIIAVVNDSKNQARNEGLNEGIAVAKTILAWWANNHKLLDPKSVETLVEWSEKAIAELESKIVPSST